VKIWRVFHEQIRRGEASKHEVGDGYRSGWRAWLAAHLHALWALGDLDEIWWGWREEP